MSPGRFDEPVDGNQAALHGLVRWLASGSMGGMAAFIESLKQVNPQIRFEFGLWTMVSFFAGGILTWWSWGWWERGRRVAGGSARRGWCLVAIWALVLVGGFGLPVVRLASGPRREMMIGVAFAFLVLGIVGAMLWRVVRFFDGDGEG